MFALGACGFGDFGDDPDLQDGCPSNPEPSASSGGRLGAGTFVWSCIRERDAYCGEWRWPSAVAQGARFEVGFSSVDVAGSQIMAIGSVADLGVAFEAQGEGEASLIAREADAVVDFISVWVRPVSRIVISRPKGRATDAEGCDITDWSPGGAHAEVIEGEQIEVQASPYDGPTLLAGDLDYSWESLTPELLAVTPSRGRLAQIDGLAEGTGRVAVRVGAFEEIIEVPVLPTTVESTGAEEGTTGAEEGTTGATTGDEPSTGSTGSTGGTGGTGGSGSGGESSGGSR